MIVKISMADQDRLELQDFQTTGNASAIHNFTLSSVPPCVRGEHYAYFNLVTITSS